MAVSAATETLPGRGSPADTRRGRPGSRPVGALARRTFRDARVRTIAFAYLFAVASILNPVAYRHTYSTLAERLAFADSFGHNKAVVLFYGKAYDLLTVGGYSAWRTGGILAILAAIFGLLAGVRALRAEEDAGRAELVLAGPVSRGTVYASAIAGIAAGAALLWVAVLAGLVIGGLAAGGSAYLALAVVSMVPVFAGVGALASQFAPTRRMALELGGAVVVLSFLLRTIADTSGSLGWLRWATPLGWAEELRPFTGAQPLVLLLPIAASVLALLGAWRLAARRDVGAGLLPARDSAEPRLRLLSSPTAQALRGELGSLTVWLTGVGAFALIVGVISKSISSAGISPQLQREFAKLGEGSIVTPHGYLAFSFSFFVLVASLFSCSQIAAARHEESEERLETLLALPVGRRRWLTGRLALAAGGAIALSAGRRPARLVGRGHAERRSDAAADARSRRQLPAGGAPVPRDRGARLRIGAEGGRRHRLRPGDGRVPVAAHRLIAGGAEVARPDHPVCSRRLGARAVGPRRGRRGDGRGRAARSRGGAGGVRPP